MPTKQTLIKTQFLPNTYIGDLNVSRLTADEVESKTK